MASSTTTQQDSSSSSKRHFHWTIKVGTELDDPEQPSLLKSSSSSATSSSENQSQKTAIGGVSERRKQLPQVAVARIRSVVLSALGKTIKQRGERTLGSKVVGTLFGSRRGHVHFAFQKDPSSQPTFLIELATPISGLVKEMASGLVRIALECDKKKDDGKRTATTNKTTSVRLLEEDTWRTYCNGKKSGFATRRECGPHDWKILKAVEPISMGAGVLPPENDKNLSEDDVMYMRAKFERVVGSRDSEAFYMMNPDSNGAPELSIYLLRL